MTLQIGNNVTHRKNTLGFLIIVFSCCLPYACLSPFERYSDFSAMLNGEERNSTCSRLAKNIGSNRSSFDSHVAQVAGDICCLTVAVQDY